jgi:uncharacterized protein GlcG (DUF336 family)
VLNLAGRTGVERPAEVAAFVDHAWNSAVAFRRPIKVFEDALAQGGANLRLLGLGGANPLDGGWPIVIDGKVAGGIGVSGVTGAQDAQGAPGSTRSSSFLAVRR